MSDSMLMNVIPKTELHNTSQIRWVNLRFGCAIDEIKPISVYLPVSVIV